MRKLFLLIPALVLAIAVNAKVIYIEPGTSLAYTINDADAGDVIVMADGLYPGEDQLHLTKDITIKAAEGASPVVYTTYYSELKSGAKVNIEGITFDGTNSSQQCIRVYDATAGKELHLNKCEFKNYPKDVISGDKAEYTLDSCVVNNCYFHDNTYSPIYFNKSSVEGKQTIYGLKVTNSTFANNDPSKEYRSVIDVQSYNREATDEIEVVVDHCTFYNNTTINYDYSAIRTRVANRTTVSNCIFAHPSAIEFYATNVWAGNVTNCLAYNFNKGYSAPTKTNANTADPLFTDAANADFSFANNWVTMSISPACGAATNGTDLGDPRWYSTPVVPDVNFASPYQFVGAKVQIAGNLWYDNENAYLYYNNKSECGVATWKINATRSCILQATLNMNAATTSGHKFKVEVLDANGNSVGETAEPSQSSAAGDIALPDQITLPAAGIYTVKLYNLQSWSSSKIDGVTFSYVGGDVQAMPGTTNIADAWFSAQGTREDGKIDFPDGYIQDGWVKWNVSFAAAGNYKVTVNIDNTNGHNYTVGLYTSESDENPILVTEGGQKSTVGTLNLGEMTVPAGNYIMKVTNATQYSDAKLISVNFAYAGGAVVTVPAEELVGQEAVLVNDGSLKVTKLANGDLKYGDNGSPLTEYVYWNINATKRGNMKVTLNVVAPEVGSASGHRFLVELYSNLSGSPIASSEETADSYGTGAIALTNPINIPATGNYIIKLTNQKQYSSAILHSIEFEYLGGATITVPANALIGEEAVLVDGGHLKVSKLENGDLKYGDNGNPLDEYVYWNINASKYGRMNVTANVVFDDTKDAEHQSSHQFLVELYSDLNESPISSSAEESATHALDAVAMPALNIPATGNYIIKLTNQKQWSSTILHSIEFAYAGGEVADVPGQIVAADAMLLKEDGGTLKMYLDENEDIKYNNNGYNLTEYALWNINATEAGEMIVTLNVTNSGHLFTVELYEGETLKSSVEEADGTKWDDGNITLEDHLTIPAAGAYTIKLINRQQYSGGAIHGITFTKYVAPAAIVIDEMDEDNSAWIGYKGGDPVNVQLNRTLKAGMYNTFCLPFAVSSSQCESVFGSDVEIYTLGSAVVDGAVLNVTLDPSSDIYQGTPVFIKPSADVVNPSFEGVSIVKETPAATTKTNANLVGSFVKTTLAGGENILYLGPDNTLYYPEIDTPIKGMRAWFVIHDAPVAAPMIKRMRIVENTNVVTEINIVGAEKQTLKTIENGQLIIIRDGMKYNVMGIRL